MRSVLFYTRTSSMEIGDRAGEWAWVDRSGSSDLLHGPMGHKLQLLEVAQLAWL